MKKFLAILLLAVVLFSLTACGGDENIKVNVKATDYYFVNDVEIPNEDIFVADGVELKANENTITDLLLALQDAGKITLETDSDTGVITAINGLKSYKTEDNLKTYKWCIFLNGEQISNSDPTDGSISKSLDTVLKDGDELLFKYYTIDLTGSEVSE